MMDAWAQLHELEAKYLRYWEFRDELKVLADGPGRCVKLNDTSYNVGTVRAYIALLTTACDFVDESNPEWASHNYKEGYNSREYVEKVCPLGHRTFNSRDSASKCSYKKWPPGSGVCHLPLSEAGDGRG